MAEVEAALKSHQTSEIDWVTFVGSGEPTLHSGSGFDLSGYDTVMDAVIAIITRHPMREDQLESALKRWAPAQVQQTLVELSTSGRAHTIERYGVRFWSAAPAHYPDPTQSQRTASGQRR